MNHRAVYIASNSGLGTWHPIGRLTRADGYYEFVYLKGIEDASGTKYLPGMANYKDVYRSKELFPFFKNRLLSEKRDEYKKFLDWTGLDNTGLPPEPLAILELTEGKKSTDNYELFPCPVPQGVEKYYEFKFFLHGSRHFKEHSRKALLGLEVNEPLRALLDWQNPKNPGAFLLCNADSVNLGYVPDYLTQEVLRLLDTCSPDSINFSVEKVNPDAPAGFSLLCSLRACWLDDSVPFSDEAFKPIPVGVPESCSSVDKVVY